MNDNELKKQLRRKLSSVYCACCCLMFISQSIAGDGTRNSNRDRDALVALENKWLKNEHNPAELENILAAEFLHPVGTGDILTKAEHIKFCSTRPTPADRTKHFEHLQVRVYGNVGIVNGLVVSTDTSGSIMGETVFTDVFVYRDGRWQAINGQENAVQ